MNPLCPGSWKWEEREPGQRLQGCGIHEKGAFLLTEPKQWLEDRLLWSRRPLCRHLLCVRRSQGAEGYHAGKHTIVLGICHAAVANVVFTEASLHRTPLRAHHPRLR